MQGLRRTLVAENSTTFEAGTLSIMATTKYRVGIIGLGRPRNSDGWTGWGMSHSHARGYNASGSAEIVALCDIVEEKAHLFNTEHAEGRAAIYTDYQKMLTEANLDVVSICTWPALHAPMTIAAAQAGVKAIHCEKPMAPTWAEAKQMAAVCEENGVQLTFNHQRRFLEAFQTARQLVRDGAIGELKRIEGACDNMMDWGTHWINMFQFYNGDEHSVQSVMAQVDARSPRFVYGVPMETRGVSVFQFDNGVTATLFTGKGSGDIVGCSNRLIGTEGSIEVHDADPKVRVRGKGDTELRAAELITVPGGEVGDKAITRGVADLLNTLGTTQKPLLDVSNALKTTEVIFATYESARRRGAVDLPLDFDGHALQEMLNDGVFPAAVAEAQATDAVGRSNHLV